MRYWIILLLTLVMSSIASAESLVASNVEVSEVRANLTIYTWTGSFEGSGGFTTCYLDLSLMDSLGEVVHQESIQAGVYQRTQVRTFVTPIVLQNKDAARVTSAHTKFACY